MSAKQPESLTMTCRCGAVAFEATGEPIVTAACYCASCREAGGRIEQLPDAAPVLEPDGSTNFVLQRKDRIRCTKGGERLEDHRLTPDAPTRRVVATCCNSAMFLEFTKGHWLSLYRNRMGEGAPPLEMRVMTRDRREGVQLPGDVPSYATHSGKFMWRLLSAWAAMGFRVPAVQGARA
jgi:hypothetical protein